tara:strand:- start:232 stop:552 length:321 start_codon:yes stop_codon:yes gene_type:complete
MNEMKLSKDGKVIEAGIFQGDPFIDERWPDIVAEAQSQFPGVDLIVFQVKGHYTGLASISESLDPMELATTMMRRGIMVMGSNQKVNVMTNQQFLDVVQLIEGTLK